MIRHGRFFVFGLLFLGLICPHIQASYDYKFDKPQMKNGQFESDISAKLSRGITNTIFGWTEIFRTPADWANRIDRGVPLAVSVGIPYGVLRAVGRTLVGVYEIVTCYAPQKPLFAPIEGEIL